jgi:hypothetical protein
MDKIYVIPNDLIFSPCKVDGLFWKEFHTLISYLGDPETLVELEKTNPQQYAKVIDCLITFVRETESELSSKGYLKEVSLIE